MFLEPWRCRRKMHNRLLMRVHYKHSIYLWKRTASRHPLTSQSRWSTSWLANVRDATPGIAARARAEPVRTGASVAARRFRACGQTRSPASGAPSCSSTTACSRISAPARADAGARGEPGLVGPAQARRARRRQPPQVRMSTKWPSMAAAAAMTGDTRCVRPSRPWRPSKLRFEVEAQRWPRLQLVGVHAEAHRAAGLAPLEARRLEDLVEAFGFGLRLHEAGARNDHRVGEPARRSSCPRRSWRRRAGPRCGRWCTSRSRRRRAGCRSSWCRASGPCTRARAAWRRACSRRRPWRDRAPRR